jgi:L-alanine-DL-glutamate epimerase-like enolase superfamily enzyme
VKTFRRLAGLELALERYDLLPLTRSVASGFVRRTTAVRMAGGGLVGLGEEVAYGQADQDRFQRTPGDLDLAGRYTLEEFCARLLGLDLLTGVPSQPAYAEYRRWAFESAALDLALRQAGLNLAQALGQDTKPLHFIVSMGLGTPPSTRRLERVRERSPGARFKLDATPAWSVELLRELAHLGCVDVVDFKGAYRGTPVDQPADPGLYGRVLELLPGVLVEDPHVNRDVQALLAGSWDRVAWDAPIRSVDDILEREGRFGAINVKPSRLGTLRGVCEVYDHCAARGIPLYAGGQFELGPGRAQIQALAAIFHPAAPNDVAPVVFHDEDPGPDAPTSPLPPPPPVPGFGAGVSG